MAVNTKKKVTFFTDSELKWHEDINYKVNHEKTLSFNKDKVTMFVKGMHNVINEADYNSNLITDSTYVKYDIVPSDNVIMTVIFKLGICSVVDITHVGNYLNRVHDKIMISKDFESRLVNLCKCGLCFCYEFKDIYGTKKELYSLTRAGNSLVYHQNAKMSNDGIFNSRYDDDFSFYGLYETLKYAEASKAIATLIKNYDGGVKYKVNSSFFDTVKRKNYRTYGFYNATVGNEDKYILIEPWKTNYGDETFVDENEKGDFISYSAYADNRIEVLQRIIRSQPTKFQDGTNDNFKLLFVCEDETSIKDLVGRINEFFEPEEKETVLITSSYILSAVNILKNPVFYRFNGDKLENCIFNADFVNKVL